MLLHPSTGNKESQDIAQALYELTVLQLMAAAHISAAFSSNLFSFLSFLSIPTQVNLTYARVTASLFIDFVSLVKIHPPTFLIISTLSFQGKYGFCTLSLTCSNSNPYVLQGESGKRNLMYCLD